MSRNFCLWLQVDVWPYLLYLVTCRNQLYNRYLDRDQFVLLVCWASYQSDFAKLHAALVLGSWPVYHKSLMANTQLCNRCKKRNWIVALSMKWTVYASDAVYIVLCGFFVDVMLLLFLPIANYCMHILCIFCGSVLYLIIQFWISSSVFKTLVFAASTICHFHEHQPNSKDFGRTFCASLFVLYCC